MTDLILWACLVAGITYAVTESAFLGSLRVYLASVSDFLLTGLYCRKCVGFWAGASAAQLLPLDVPWWPAVACGAFAGAGFMWLACGFLPAHEAWEYEEKIITAIRHTRAVRRTARERSGG